MVAIIDYGMGNVASVQKALNFLNLENAVTADFHLIDNSEFIILPGVGSFLQGMKNLQARGLDKFLTEQVVHKKKKFLGICLGMQLIASTGREPYVNPGLGWVNGEVQKIENISLRVPHMGWNNIDIKLDKYFGGITHKDFYFIHSYHFVQEDVNVVASTTNYGIEIVASVQQDNIFATQFHPEKSQESGLALLRNFFHNA